SQAPRLQRARSRARQPARDDARAAGCRAACPVPPAPPPRDGGGARSRHGAQQSRAPGRPGRATRALPAPRRPPGRAAPRRPARRGGGGQFLADRLGRRPTLLSWLLEPSTMRQWLGDELAADLEQSAQAFDRAEGRWNALRRFKYRQLLRIGSRDILGDADLTVTTEELSRMADVCLAAA